MTWNNTYTCLIFGSTFLIGMLFPMIPLFKEETRKRKILIMVTFTIVHYLIVFLSTYLDQLILDATSNSPVNWGNFFYIRYFVIYAFDIAVLFFLGKANMATSLFIVNLGYCFQHACQYLYQIITSLLNLSMFTWEAFLIRLAFTIVFVAIFYFAAHKRLDRIDQSKIKLNSFLVFFTTAATLFLIVANSYFWNFTKDSSLTNELKNMWQISILLFTGVIALLLMMLQLSVLKSDELTDDLRITKKMLHEEKNHYEREKDLIDLVNIKSHDLKHQLLASKHGLSEESKQELDKIVSDYDSFFKTGNEAVDVILTEKELLCKKKDIRFTAMIDGSKFSFLKESDVYSLLGNVIDNAIEATSKLENEEERVISISTETKGGLLLIHEENFYDGNIIIKNNEFQTIKKNKAYHGFGLKSIKLLTERYHGDLSLRTDNNRFVIDILIPINAHNENK